MKYYLFVMADNIVNFFTGLGTAFSIISVVLGTVLIPFTIDDFKLGKNVIIKILKITIPITILSILLATFLPNTKQLAAIFILPKIVENGQLNAIPDKLLNLCDEWIKDATNG